MERLVAQLALPSFIFNGDVEISLPICNYQLKNAKNTILVLIFWGYYQLGLYTSYIYIFFW